MKASRLVPHFFGKYTMKKLLGRQSCRWDNDIKNYICTRVWECGQTAPGATFINTVITTVELFL